MQVLCEPSDLQRDAAVAKQNHRASTEASVLVQLEPASEPPAIDRSVRDVPDRVRSLDGRVLEQCDS